MNEKDLQHKLPHDEHDAVDSLSAPDAFESVWIGRLAEPEQDLESSEDAFVAGVLARHQAEQDKPVIAGRIRPAALPYAAAAAVLIAALTGWLIFRPAPSQGPGNNLTGVQPANPAPQPQPDTNTPVRNVDPGKIKLGSLIAQAQNGVIRPADSLTATLEKSSGSLDLSKLIELFESPVPDLKELLAPEETNNQQSRA